MVVLRKVDLMKLRGNIILQYSLVTFGIVFVISVALGTTLARQITDYLLRAHIRLYPEIVRLTVKDDARIYGFFDTAHPAAATPDIEKLFGEFLSLGNIYRVKIWSRDATILWSDQKELIGQQFSDDDELQSALRGTVRYEIAQLEKRENFDEDKRGTTLEIYTPVLHNGKVVGVIELYEANNDLFAQISRTTRFAWTRTAAAGGVLYVLLFFIFERAYRRQRTTHEQLVETQDVTIFALAYQAELRDQQTGKHLERTSIYVRLLAEQLAKLPEYRTYLTSAYIADLVKSAPLHDIGKVGVPDSILLKPGKLTHEEMEEMKKHCEYGTRILRWAEQKLKFQSFLTIAVQLTLHHHEKWNGEGYPQGLAGEKIPVSARIMAIADVYDAMSTKRVYKDAFPHEECLRLIKEQRGSHFDPQLVDVFLEKEADFKKTSKELVD
jgi:HD-GYP domain-containing protein (c-di-GMP phosphodiesterase class II)